MGPRVFHAKFQPNRSKGVGLTQGVRLVIFKKMVPFDYVEFYSVSDWYRKLFDTEKAVPPKNQFLYGKGGTNNIFNFTTVPLVPRLVPHYRFFRRPNFYQFFRDF